MKMPTQIKEDSKVAAGPSVVIVEVNIEDKAGVQVWGISLAKNAHNNLTYISRCNFSSYGNIPPFWGK